MATRPVGNLASLKTYFEKRPLPEAPELSENHLLRSYEGDACGRGSGVYCSASDYFFPYEERENWAAMAEEDWAGSCRRTVHREQRELAEMRRLYTHGVGGKRPRCLRTDPATGQDGKTGGFGAMRSDELRLGEHEQAEASLRRQGLEVISDADGDTGYRVTDEQAMVNIRKEIGYFIVILQFERKENWFHIKVILIYSQVSVKFLQLTIGQEKKSYIFQIKISRKLQHKLKYYVKIKAI